MTSTEDKKHNRRAVLTAAFDGMAAVFFLGLIGLFVHAVTGFVRRPKFGRRGASEELKVWNFGSRGPFEPNSAVPFVFAGEPAILARDSQGTFHAYVGLCTHLGCALRVDARTSTIVCPCHNGIFDLNGNNVSGPPPKPLTPLVVRQQGSSIYVAAAST